MNINHQTAKIQQPWCYSDINMVIHACATNYASYSRAYVYQQEFEFEFSFFTVSHCTNNVMH